MKNAFDPKYGVHTLHRKKNQEIKSSNPQYKLTSVDDALTQVHI